MRVIAFDLLGFGQSPKPEWISYSVEQHASAVIASLHTAHVRQPVTIVAHSMGCLIAVHIAAKRPELVKQLILYEPPLYADLPQYRKHIKQRKRYFALYQRIADNPDMVFRYISRLGKTATRISGFSLDETTWLPFERSLRNTIMRQRAYDELHSIYVPTIIIHGRLDMVVANAEIRQMLRDNSNISFYKVSDAHGISFVSARFIAQLLRTAKAAKRTRRST